MNLTLLSPENPSLNNISLPVLLSDLKSGKHEELIESLFRFARGEQADQNKKVLVGLSAPQVGQFLRIILVDFAAKGKGETGDLRELINPKVLSESKEKEEWYEGCFSAGNITAIVKRPTRIEIVAYDRKGNQVRQTVTGYTARIIEHETDHLNGLRFPDRRKDIVELHKVESNQWPDYRNNNGWRNWPHKASFKDWEQMKRIGV